MARVIDIEQEYQTYLHNARMVEDSMPINQRIEMRRVFYAAFGQAFLSMRDKIGNLPEDQAIAALDDIKDQVANFFTSQN